MSSSPQNFKFPDEDDFAHLGDEEMSMLMESAGYVIKEQDIPHYAFHTALSSWLLIAPAPVSTNYLIPNCSDVMRVREAFKMFMHLHAKIEYR